ncbi:EVE domain-containing protein [Aliiroseovarius crassostreae]|uniref:EVE domain-containing protein n=1 Tax=Aliiroseovarius crassostreae TaxID=154981 RepID=A0A0P7KI40_9RHOB|nr:EVE domain-containing protein [Aliiroseovarius crassostreae]KPN61549.1 hypothetical protein AKJ29_18375 [Aliiroseovarius crassostreae]SFU92598.1 EVE domain-containing protein [Aliiroseovarius crassostreae]
MTHWIAVISRAHARIAAQSGFLQVCHGKAAPLRRTSAGDEVFIYCPREEMRGGAQLKRVEYRCTFNDDRVYQVEQAPGFTPFRKDVTFDTGFAGRPIHDVPGLELTANPNWGMLARRGFFEISAHDAGLLRASLEDAA